MASERGGRRCRRCAAADEHGLRLARSHCHGARAERAVKRLSRAGEYGAVWFAIGALGAVVERERRAQWRAASGTVAGAYALNTALKLLVRRRRPTLAGLPALIDTPTQLSFPSAHATTSFAGALAYARLGLPGRLLYPLAASLALSRLYLGVHYPSDVAAGALLGSAVAARCAPSKRRSP